MIDQLNAIAEQWFQWQWPMLWQSTVLIVLVAVSDRIIRKWAWPQLRYALWLLVLVKLMLPPTLSSPVSVTSPIPTWADKVQIVPAMIEPEAPVLETSYAMPEIPDLQASSVTVASAPVPENPVTVKTVLSWKAYGMVSWLLVAMALAVGLAIRLRRLRQEHLMDRSHHAPEWFYEALEKAAKEIGCARLPKVVLSRHVLCPAVFGLFRPVLLVPAEQMDHMSPTDARHILLHELAHIKRLDLWSHGLYMLLLMAYWFNPLLWLMRRHLQNLRELCCDATVARTLKEHTPAYRETLLETAKSLLAQPVDPGLGLLGLFENSTWLVTRLQWLEKKTWRFQRVRIVSVTLVVTLMLCCVLPMATAARLTPDHVLTVTKAVSDGAEVNGDVQVRLLGICDYPCDSKPWWRPGGEVMDATRISDPGWRTLMNPTDDQQSVIFAYQIGNEELSDVGIAWKPPVDSQRSTYIPTYVNREKRLLAKVQYLTANFPKDKKVASLTLGIALSDWQSVTAWDGRSDGYTNDSVTDRDVHLHKAQSQDGRVHMVISHLMGSDYDCRIVAVDSDGTKHRPVSKSNTGNELRQCKATFNLALDNIKHFEFQARAYEWIEFRDIALVPHEREPEIRPNVQQAEAIIARLDVLFSSAYAALVFRDEPKRALEIIQAESPSLDQLLPKVKGTNMEQSVSMAIEAAHQTQQALGAGDLAKAKDLMPGILKAQRRLETLFLKKEAGGSSKVQTVRSRVLTLAEPQYEWWLAKPAKEISVAQGEPLTIEWSIREDLYDELEFLAVGVVPVGVDISENERYQWLANDIPITVRKTQYGKVWPVSYALMGKPNKEAEPLTPGNYRIMVFGFKSGGGEAVGDWRHILNNNLMCVAAAGLVVEPAAVNSVSPDRPTDKRLAIRNALNDRLTREDKAILKQEMSLISKEWLFSDKVLPGDTLCEHYSVKTGDSFWKIGEACKVPYTLILQINEIENANSIRSGQQIKVINGPFHAKVWSSTCKMDLYLQDMYVKTYDIGLGKPGQDTPTGQWVVKEAGKLRRPPWTDPDTGRRLIPDDPDYPLGEGYMALKGVQGDAVSRQGFGIHGTQDRAIIGQQDTSGTIAMLNADFLELFGLLKEETSVIEVAD